MKIVSIGGGPAGLYLGILLKRADPRHEVTILERNRADDTFGFGVVFSDATLSNLAGADPETYEHIRRHFAHWDDIETHVGGEVWRSTGHGFCGLERKELLVLLQDRCAALGVDLRFETEVAGPEEVESLRQSCDLLVGADGVGSLVRQTYADELGPSIDVRPNRFVWLGTTAAFQAFTFLFRENAHGLWRVHAYRYREGGSTFIVECTDATFRRAGLAEADEDATIAYLEELFAGDLRGHRLIKNRSIWRRFPTVENRRWHHENLVLLGDAAHTAHFSIGSGTKLAMEDAIDLSRALAGGGAVEGALARYEAARRPTVERIQRAAQVSLEWFEDTERYQALAPIQFTHSLLTRSLRVTHDNLRLRDPAFVDAVDRWFAGTGDQPAPPPMFTPLELRGLRLANRVVAAATPIERARAGALSAAHLATAGARALGGAGLVMADWAAVSAAGRTGEGSAGLWDDAQIESWRELAELTHGESEAALGVCLGHGGRRALTPVGPAALALGDGPRPAVLDAGGQDAIVEAFRLAAGRAAEARLDLLDLDLAGGRLLASWLSPLSHPEGGSLEARAAFPLAVVDAVRAAWRGPLSVRLSACDWAPGGTEPGDAVTVARWLRERGVDLVWVTSGGTVAHEAPRRGRLYQAMFADRVRQEAGVPTVAEGGIASWDDVNSVLAAGRADLCALGAAHAFDPNWTRRAATEQGVRLPWPAPLAAADGFVPRGGGAR